jgi:hypothetical protein
MPVDARHALACAGHSSAVGDEAVRLVGRAGGQGLLKEQVERTVGVPTALEQAVVAAGGERAVVGEPGGEGADQLGEGFAGEGHQFGDEEVSEVAVGFGAFEGGAELLEEVLDVVYWMCCWVGSIGWLLSLCDVGFFHSGDRNTRWSILLSRGAGGGIVKSDKLQSS